jgi:5-methylcytosine-specific restriction enzyme subunit McrC
MTALENLFAGIPMDDSLAYLPEVESSLEEGRIPETREYYIDVCRTAVLLVSHRGLLPDIEGKEKTLSFLVNMEQIFEKYCLRVLQERSDVVAWHSVKHGKDEKLFLFSDPRYDNREAEPDILIKGNGGCQLVVEVKYKPKPLRDDINQAVTYAVRFDISRVVLLCFSESVGNSGWKFLGVVGDKVAVWVYRIFLDSSDMEAEELRYVHAMNEMLYGRVEQPT